MKETVVILVLWLLFAASHMLLSSHTLRPRLVARLGDTRFMAAYSAVAFVFFVPLVYYAFTHLDTGPLLWSAPDAGAVRFLIGLANVAGFVLMVSGIMTPSPAAVAAAPRDTPVGAQRITRHPLFMGIGIWGLAHLAGASHASEAAFFGGFVAFVLAGAWHQDRRKLATGDERFRRFHAATAFVPFTRRGALRGLMELSPAAVIIGVVAALLARYLHPATGG